MQERKLLEKEEIIQCLMRLGEELEALGIESPVRLLMIGGAYMVTQVGNRRFTEDVDVLAYLDRRTEEYFKLRSAASFVSVDMHVDNRWFSDSIGDKLLSVGNVPPGELWLQHGMLEVYIPGPEYVLALKLLAGGRDKDIGDLQTLCQTFRVKTRKQAMRVLKKYFITEALEAYEPEINQTFGVLIKAGLLK